MRQCNALKLHSEYANMWYERHPYKMEIVGSTPTLTTMKEEVSEYYKEKGFKSLYVNVNKEPRRVAILVHEDGNKITMSYAKYLYTSYYKEDVDKSFHIDHINGNKMDDRIENLQKITGNFNRKKDHEGKEYIMLTCPVCGREFLFEKRNLPFKNNPCCSRKCGGIKSHWK